MLEYAGILAKRLTSDIFRYVHISEVVYNIEGFLLCVKTKKVRSTHPEASLIPPQGKQANFLEEAGFRGVVVFKWYAYIQLGLLDVSLQDYKKSFTKYP